MEHASSPLVARARRALTALTVATPTLLASAGSAGAHELDVPVTTAGGPEPAAPAMILAAALAVGVIAGFVYLARHRRTGAVRAAVALLVGLNLFAAGLGLADAHTLNNRTFPNDWHWNKGGSQIVLRTYIYGTPNAAAAEAARANGWNTIGILYNYRVYDPNYAEIRVWDAAYGNVGWSGYGGFNYTGSNYHAWGGYAKYNNSVGWNQSLVQGVFCQEMGHAFGLGHSNTGDCMGLTYYNWDRFFFGSHNNSDFFNMYRYHPVQ